MIRGGLLAAAVHAGGCEPSPGPEKTLERYWPVCLVDENERLNEDTLPALKMPNQEDFVWGYQPK